MTAAVDLVAILAAVGVLIFALTPLIDWHRHKILRRTVADVGRVFDEAGIDYWCDFGTLLGFHRDGDVIRGDKDADFCILSPEKPRVLALGQVLERHGYSITDRGGRARNVVRISDRRTGYHIDVYEYTREGETLRSVLASPQEDLPAALVTTRVRASFLGAPVRVPHDVHGVLVRRYGPDYLIPRRGDKGATRPYSRIRSMLEDVQDNCLGLWALVWSMLG